jgi:glycerophosphoryl diester phosphodiesterase
MTPVFRFVFLIICMVLPGTLASAAEADIDQHKWILATGATEHLPASSLAGFVLALERGAEAIKVDLVLSSDNRLVVMGDPLLTTGTDGAEIYPERVRPDGTLYSFDLSLAEFRGISSISDDRSHMPTAILSLAQVLDYLARLDPALETRLALICELRKGWLHDREGRDLSGILVSELRRAAPRLNKIDLFIASYDPTELQRINETLLSSSAKDLQLIQLIGNNDGMEVMSLELGHYRPYNYDWLFTRFGLKAASAYAQAIGIGSAQVLDQAGHPMNSDYLDSARSLGLKVLAYPADPKGSILRFFNAERDETLFERLLFEVGLDGMLTAHDAFARKWLAERSKDVSNGPPQSIERLIERIEDRGITPALPLQSD